MYMHIISKDNLRPAFSFEPGGASGVFWAPAPQAGPCAFLNYILYILFKTVLSKLMINIVFSLDTSF